MSVSTLKTGEAHGEIDPYAEWLSIGMDNRPITHYALMGFSQAEAVSMVGRALTEKEKKRVEAAADRNMGFVRQYQTGSQSALSQRILNELAKARVVLLDDAQKLRYDGNLGTSISIGPHQGVRQALFTTTGSQKVELGIEPPKTKRPQPRQVTPAPKGNGAPVTTGTPVVPPAVVPPKAPPPVLEVLDHGPAVTPEQGWNFAGASENSSIETYKRKKQEQSWLQKNTGAVVATVGGIAVVGVTGLYAIFGGGKPADSKDNRPVAESPDNGPTKPPLVKPTLIPKVEPEAPVIGQPIQEDPAPPQVAINNIPEVKIDPAVEAKRLAEEQKKREEEAQKKFDADVERLVDMLRVPLLHVPTANMRALAEGEKDPAKQKAFTKLFQEKLEEDGRKAQFQSDVEAMYREFAKPESQYSTARIDHILGTVSGEKDPVTRAALCVLAATRSGREGRASSITYGLSLVKDPRMPEEKLLSIRTQILQGNTNASTKDISVPNRLKMADCAIRNVEYAIRLEKYDVAEQLITIAQEYLKGVNYASVRDAKERTDTMNTLKELRAAIAEKKQKIATLQPLYAAHASGLDLVMEPKGPAERLQSAIYVLETKQDWKKATGYLQSCNDPLLSKAAQMETATTKNPEGYYMLAMAWKAAADANAGGRAATWYARASEWLAQAEKGNPKGKLKLDVDLLRKELGEKGLLVEPNVASPDIPSPKEEPTAIDATSLPITGHSVLSDKKKVDIEVNKPIQLAYKVPLVNPPETKSAIYVHAPGFVAVDISSLESKTPVTFEAILCVKRENGSKTDGVVWTIEAVNSKGVRSIVHRTPQSFDPQSVSISLPANTKGIIITNHPGANNDYADDWGYVVNPTVITK